ncbi:MAG: hypothetical protein JXL97_10405 [Bacteroidales bacterium]|nr:hypothetical protein [Bacteroidales bacterium]
MKKLFWIIIIVLVIFLILGFLYSQGVINVKWQPLAMILAAFAAPFTFISNFLKGKSVRTDKILKQQKDSMDNLNNRKAKFDVYMKAKDTRIQNLEAEIIKLKDDISNTELQIKEKKQEVNQMTDINDLQNAFMEGYTDES